MATWNIVLGSKVVAVFKCNIHAWWRDDEALQQWMNQYPDAFFPEDLQAVKAK